MPASSIARADASISSSGSIVSCMTPIRKGGATCLAAAEGAAARAAPDDVRPRERALLQPARERHGRLVERAALSRHLPRDRAGRVLAGLLAEDGDPEVRVLRRPGKGDRADVDRPRRARRRAAAALERVRLAAVLERRLGRTAERT